MDFHLKEWLKMGARFLLVVVVGIVLWSLYCRIPHRDDQRFMKDWAQDLKNLENRKYLPPGFNDIHEVRLVATSDIIKKTFAKFPLDFHKKPSGRYDLEIFADLIEEGGVVVQYDLIDLKSGNLVWEMGRTFKHELAQPSPTQSPN